MIDNRSRPARIVIPVRPDITNLDRAGTKLIAAAQRNAMFMLRLSLAAVFFWFGILKVANVSPAVDLLKHSFTFLATTPYIQCLGVAEMFIGIGLVSNRLSKQATVLMVLHLVGTLSVAIIAPSLIFAPSFPVLTMDGEFLVKNLVLIMAGLVIIFSRER